MKCKLIVSILLVLAIVGCGKGTSSSGTESVPAELRDCVDSELPKMMAQAREKNPDVPEAMLRKGTTRLAIGACKLKAKL